VCIIGASAITNIGATEMETIARRDLCEDCKLERKVKDMFYCETCLEYRREMAEDYEQMAAAEAELEKEVDLRVAQQ
jgi:UDP-N-acetylenolpyruvoylglucosamine reductase